MFVLVITRLGALFINHLRHFADPLRERRLGDNEREHTDVSVLSVNPDVLSKIL